MGLGYVTASAGLDMAWGPSPRTSLCVDGCAELLLTRGAGEERLVDCNFAGLSLLSGEDWWAELLRALPLDFGATGDTGAGGCSFGKGSFGGSGGAPSEDTARGCFCMTCGMSALE